MRKTRVTKYLWWATLPCMVIPMGAIGAPMEPELLISSETRHVKGNQELAQGDVKLRQGAVWVRCQTLRTWRTDHGQALHSEGEGQVRVSWGDVYARAQHIKMKHGPQRATLEGDVQVWMPGDTVKAGQAQEISLKATRAEIDFESRELVLDNTQGALPALRVHLVADDA